MWTVARGVIRNPQLSERCVQPVQNVSESEAKGGRLARVVTDLATDQSETKKMVSRGVKYLRWWSRKDRLGPFRPASTAAFHNLTFGTSVGSVGVNPESNESPESGRPLDSTVT